MPSLSLTAYLALVRKTSTHAEHPLAERPDGLLIWAHAHDHDDIAPLIYLGERYRQNYGPAHLLITGDVDGHVAVPNVIFANLPDDTQRHVSRFLDHWTPDVGIWAGGDLLPLLISDAHKANIPMLLVNARSSAFGQPLWRWLPSLAKETLRVFQHVFTSDAATAALMRKLGTSTANVSVTGPMQVATSALPVRDDDRDMLAQTLAGRPVWAASSVQKEELSDIFEAHRFAMRHSHRALLICVCADFETSIEAQAIVRQNNWRMALWDNGDIVDENTQVVMCEDTSELGLWYRVAPVSFLGSSLSTGLGGIDPYAAAALGSAIVYGPNVRNYLHSYSRLAEVGAARIVRDADSLARAVPQLLAADQAASMAHSAWEVISSGAEVTDKVMEMMQDCLDQVKAK